MRNLEDVFVRSVRSDNRGNDNVVRSGTDRSSLWRQVLKGVRIILLQPKIVAPRMDICGVTRKNLLSAQLRCMRLTQLTVTCKADECGSRVYCGLNTTFYY